MPTISQHNDSTGKLVFDSEQSDDEVNASGTTSSDDIIKYINDPTLLDELDQDTRQVVEMEIEAYKADQAELQEIHR